MLNWEEQALRPFVLVKDHVLLPQATELEAVDAQFRSLLTDQSIRTIVDLIPDEWLANDPSFESTKPHREVYFQFLTSRLANSNIFLNEALHAAKSII